MKISGFCLAFLWALFVAASVAGQVVVFPHGNDRVVARGNKSIIPGGTITPIFQEGVYVHDMRTNTENNAIIAALSASETAVVVIIRGDNEALFEAIKSDMDLLARGDYPLIGIIRSAISDKRGEDVITILSNRTGLHVYDVDGVPNTVERVRHTLTNFYKADIGAQVAVIGSSGSENRPEDPPSDRLRTVFYQPAQKIIGVVVAERLQTLRTMGTSPAATRALQIPETEGRAAPLPIFGSCAYRYGHTAC